MLKCLSFSLCECGNSIWIVDAIGALVVLYYFRFFPSLVICPLPTLIVFTNCFFLVCDFLIIFRFKLDRSTNKRQQQQQRVEYGKKISPISAGNFSLHVGCFSLHCVADPDDACLCTIIHCDIAPDTMRRKHGMKKKYWLKFVFKRACEHERRRWKSNLSMNRIARTQLAASLLCFVFSNKSQLDGKAH